MKQYTILFLLLSLIQFNATANQVFVTGNVSGQWTNNNTYIIDGDITVLASDSLIIDAGTTIKFNGYYSINGLGTIRAIGTSTEPILFTSNKSSPAMGDWYAIIYSTSRTIYKNCILEYGSLPLYSTVACSAQLVENEIRSFTKNGITSFYGTPVISKNSIHDFNYNHLSIGIYCYYNPPMTIECNKVYNGASIGMVISGNILVRNNEIYDINGFNGGQRIGIDIYVDTPHIHNNYIHNCSTAIRVGNNFSSNTPAPVISNNTLINNLSIGIDIGGFLPYANAYIINNIIANNQRGIYQYSSNDTIYALSNNLIWNNTNGNYDNVQISGIGVLVTTNAQGNPIDSYSNMSQDPMFDSAPMLNATSPCYGSGNVTYSSDVGFDTSSTCMNIGTPVTIYSHSKNQTQVSVFPNPFTNELNIKYTNENAGKPDIELTDMMGKDVSSLITLSASSGSMLNFKTTALPIGAYCISIKSNASKPIHLLIIKSE